MRNRCHILGLILFFITEIATAQSTHPYNLQFIPVFGQEVLKLNDTFYTLNYQDSVKIEALKFYISNIEFLKNDISVWKENKSYHLVNAANEASMILALNVRDKIDFNQIKFDLGIDSATNFAGALGGNLDPTAGMYWTWQNGYINFKLEGKSNLCKTINNEFKFHLGGYQYPFSSLQTITIDKINNRFTGIAIDVSSLLSGMGLTSINHIMSPCKEAVDMSNRISKIFSVIQP